MKTLFVLPVLLLGALFTQACTTAQITLILQAAEIAAQAALGSISPPTAGSQAASQYIAEASDAINQVGTILAGSGPDAAKGAAVTAALAGIISRDPHLPAGTPQRIVTAVGTLAQALQGVLATYGQPPVTPGLAAAVRNPKPTTDELAKARGAFQGIAKRAKSTALLARQSGT